LATAVYAASEGLSVIVLEALAFGGQAGASSRIENYLGFPTGISGQALAGRAFAQAQKFGANVVVPAAVDHLDCNHAGAYALTLKSGDTLRAKAVVIASGAEYRRPDVDGMDAVEGDGVHYWASPVEGKLCAGQEVTLVGGGNSAGQAAVYLASKAARVWMLVRGPGLEATMSKYLIDRIKAQPNITLLAQTEVQTLEAQGGALHAIAWRCKTTGEVTHKPMRHLFLFIGADPCVGWMSTCGVAADEKGFIRTGLEARPGATDALTLQTNLDGVFAIGDVRSGSTKRVAAAVGEGAAVVAQIHLYLGRETQAAPTQSVKETA
jgi:thioredoxin reductase (NADPH)